MPEQKPDPSSRSSLGRPVKIHRGRTVSSEDFFIWVLPGVLIPLALLALGAYAQLADIAPGGISSQGWVAFAAFALIPYGTLTLRRFLSARQAVLVYANGLRLRNIPAAQTSLLWCQIGSVRSAGMRYHFFGLPVADSRFLTLEPVHGKALVIPAHILDIDELADTIQQQVYPLLYENMTEDLEKGLTLNFGTISLDSRHFHVRGRPIAWEDIGSLWVEKGVLLFESGHQGRVKVPTHKINNLELLLKIIDRHFSTT